MSSRYFYLDVEIELAHSDRPELLVQQQVQEAVKQLFGASGAGNVIDVLAVRAGRALLRVPRPQLRRLRAALALRPTVRVRAEAASLQALVEADPKGSDCYEKFSVMQECMSQYPELYGKDEDEDLAAALDTAGGETSREEGGGGDQDRAGEGK